MVPIGGMCLVMFKQIHDINIDLQENMGFLV